jgi:hypothetical protein
MRDLQDHEATVVVVASVTMVVAAVATVTTKAIKKSTGN